MFAIVRMRVHRGEHAVELWHGVFEQLELPREGVRVGRGRLGVTPVRALVASLQDLLVECRQLRDRAAVRERNILRQSSQCQEQLNPEGLDS